MEEAARIAEEMEEAINNSLTMDETSSFLCESSHAPSSVAWNEGSRMGALVREALRRAEVGALLSREQRNQCAND